MPNHIHGIIVITDGTPITKDVGATLVVAHNRAGTRPAPTIRLGDVIGAFKSVSTKEYARGVRNYRWPPFAGRFWQRNYYEHVIRNEAEYWTG